MRSGPTPTEDRETVVAAHGVERVYAAQEKDQGALRGVTLEVRKGEMVAVMGPSGCGKTTLLNCLSGLDRPTRGRVVLAGFVFQAYNLIPVLTVEENVMLPLVTSGEPESAARPHARSLLERLGLGGLHARTPPELSGGEQQRVAIARALVTRPAVVFADEPTGNLDAARSADLLALLRQSNRQQGQTLVIVTHEPQVAAACDRVVRMADGRIVSDVSGRTA